MFTSNLFNILKETVVIDSGHIFSGELWHKVLVEYIWGHMAKHTYVEKNLDEEVQRVTDFSTILVMVVACLRTCWKLNKWNPCRTPHEKKESSRLFISIVEKTGVLC